ncbi:hypothetical protein ACFO3J_07125 [Streptomyces polygonati]|uniref:Integral membrane protein n=1 Tax=Streptomyces polygonati TaxID=1617087 RepID=A0ABV8HH34_9ACTN
MNALAPARRTPRWSPARPYARLRATHPVRVLRWLRTGVLITVVATALLYPLVATQAHREITAARRTRAGIQDITHALSAARSASLALRTTFGNGDVLLTHTGSEFANDMAEVSTDVTSAAQGNAAGVEGSTQIQFVQGQLTNCDDLAAEAVSAYQTYRKPVVVSDALAALTAPDERDPVTNEPIPDTGGLIATLGDLRDLQRAALERQRGSRWLDPLSFWWPLVVPAAVMLLLAAATGRLVATHFRRIVSPLLGAALLTVATVAVTVGVLSTEDERHLSADPLASHPVTLAVALSLLSGAAVLAYLAYRPRLNEYRFQRT